MSRQIFKKRKYKIFLVVVLSAFFVAAGTYLIKGNPQEFSCVTSESQELGIGIEIYTQYSHGFPMFFYTESIPDNCGVSSPAVASDPDAQSPHDANFDIVSFLQGYIFWVTTVGSVVVIYALTWGKKR